jgi:CheY-like chemotaxis protein
MSTHVLFADDSSAMRLTIADLLRRNGYTVSVARDGEEALSMILEAQQNADPFDLLLTDIQMPQMSGIELVRQLNKKAISLPVIAVSCLHDEEVVDQLRQSGCSGFLEKPFEIKQLVQAMEGVLAERKKPKGRNNSGSARDWQGDPGSFAGSKRPVCQAPLEGGEEMNCPYLVLRGVDTCVAKSRPYVPSAMRLKKYCKNRSAQPCPFYRAVMHAADERKQGSHDPLLQGMPLAGIG